MDDESRPAGPYFNRQGEPVTKSEFLRLDHSPIGDTWVGGEVEVETIFQGRWDHDYRPAPVFQTTVFGGRFDRDHEWYTSEVEAREGHDRWVSRARRALKEDSDGIV